MKQNEAYLTKCYLLNKQTKFHFFRQRFVVEDSHEWPVVLRSRTSSFPPVRSWCLWVVALRVRVWLLTRTNHRSPHYSLSRLLLFQSSSLEILTLDWQIISINVPINQINTDQIVNEWVSEWGSFSLTHSLTHSKRSARGGGVQLKCLYTNLIWRTQNSTQSNDLLTRRDRWWFPFLLNKCGR